MYFQCSENTNLLLFTQDVLSFDHSTQDFVSVFGTSSIYKRVEGYPGVVVEDFNIRVYWPENAVQLRLMFKVYSCKGTNSRESECTELADLSTIVVKAPTASFTNDKITHLPNIDSDSSNRSRNCSNFPRTIQFMEIGTSGFDTILEKCMEDHFGLSIEPINTLQELLSDRPNVRKLNYAVGPVDAFLEMHYIPKSTLDMLGYSILEPSSNYMYGVAKIGDMSPELLRSMRFNVDTVGHLSLYTRQVVPVKTIKTIFTENDIDSTELLKLDCEGYDYDIIMSALSYFRDENKNFPCLLEYESIVDPFSEKDKINFARALNLTLHSGYDVYRYFYNVDRYDDKFVYKSDNSKVYGVKRDCSQANVDRLRYLLGDDFNVALDQCKENFKALDDSKISEPSARLCVILTFKDKGIENNVILKITDRCFHGQCVV